MRATNHIILKNGSYLFSCRDLEPREHFERACEFSFSAQLFRRCPGTNALPARGQPRLNSPIPSATLPACGRRTTMAASRIDFWFTMGSTYSFLSVMRLADIERSSDVSFRWRPFHLLVILQEMNHVPFADKPAKSAYMWRDIERRAAMYGIEARLPAPYPAKQSIVANLVATVGMN